MIKSEDYSFVIQGPLFRKLPDRPDLTAHAVQQIKEFFPGAEIIISTWVGQDASGLDVDQVIFNEDPGPHIDANGEKLNVNRQILSAKNGLRAASRPFAVKFRGDFFITSDRFFREETAPVPQSEYGFFKNKIRMTNVFVQDPTKMPFLFHFSDLIMFGRREDLVDLWDITLFKDEEIKNLDGRGLNEIGAYLGGSIFRLRAEQAIPVRFLEKKGHPFKFNNPNQLSKKWFIFSERFFLANFEMKDWQKSDIVFPARMMDAFLETLYDEKTLAEVAATPELVESRYRATYLQKNLYFIFNRSYLFHLRKAIVFRYPILNSLFENIRFVKRILFKSSMRNAEQAKSVMNSHLEKVARK